MDNATFLRIAQANSNAKYNRSIDLFPVTDALLPFHLPFYQNDSTIAGHINQNCDWNGQRAGPTLISLKMNIDKMVKYATHLL